MTPYGAQTGRRYHSAAALCHERRSAPALEGDISTRVAGGDLVSAVFRLVQQYRARVAPTIANAPRHKRVVVRCYPYLALGALAAVLWSGCADSATGPQVPTGLSVVSGNAQTGTVGSPLANPLVVKVADSRGVGVPGVVVVWSVTTGGGSMSASTTTTDALGAATVTWTLGTVVGANTAAASVAGSPTITPVVLAATSLPGPATKLAFTVQPSAAAAGASVAPAVQVAVQDAYGNLVTSVATSVTLAITSGSGALGAVLGGTLTKAAESGVATFADLTVNKAGNGYTMTATSSGLSSGVSTPFDISSGPGATLVFIVQPISATAGTPINPGIQVQVQDAYGNSVTCCSVTIVLTLTPGTGAADAMLGGTVQRQTVNAVATFDNLTVDKAGASYTLSASSGATGLGGPFVSAPFTVSPGAPARLSFAVDPSTVAAGAAINPAVQVVVQDAQGNTVTSATTSVTVTITTGTGTAGATLSGTLTVAAVKGLAILPNLTINKAGIGYTLTVSGSGLTPATSGPFDVLAGALAVVVVSPNGASTTGTATAQVFAAQALDALGNPISGTTFTWASLNPSVAIVDSATGLVTPLGPGQTTVSATADGLRGFALLTVAVPGLAPVATWSSMSSPTTVELRDSWALSANDVYAVGGGSNILRFDGTTWKTLTGLPSFFLWGVGGSSASDVHAVGDGGVVFHFDGSGWTRMTSGTGSTLYSVWAASPLDVFAVGDAGTILRYNGTSWSPIASGTTTRLYRVWGSSSSDVFAVGEGGAILRFNGANWVSMATGTSNAIRGLWGFSSRDIFAAGSGGTVLHFDGSAWVSVPSGTAWDFFDMWGAAPSDLYFAASSGPQGRISHFSGSGWSTATTGSVSELWTVTGAGAALYAAGNYGQLYRGAR